MTRERTPRREILVEPRELESFDEPGPESVGEA
ncbi:MAG: hypothetical protein QOG90_873, partial [Actinomycetota bacterium]